MPVIWHDDTVEMKDQAPRLIKDMTMDDIRDVNRKLESLQRDGKPFPVPSEVEW